MWSVHAVMKYTGASLFPLTSGLEWNMRGNKSQDHENEIGSLKQKIKSTK